MKNLINKKEIMKYFKYLILALPILFIMGCDLDEEPPFLDETIYTNAQSAQATLVSLKPGYHMDADWLWTGLYQTIARCNGAISNINTTASPSSNDEVVFNDVAGHAYFVRAWSYFELVNLFGDVPLWLDLPSSDNTNKALSSKSDVVQQIISDASTAASMLNGNAGIGYPKAHAANMLLAKVYMTIATNNDLQVDGSSMDYWNLANQAAQSAYGHYSLVNDFGSLFTVQGENSTESMFELQISQDATNSQMGRNFTPWKYKAGMHFGWFRVSAFQHDKHLKAYGGNTTWNANNLSTYPDSRYKATYLSQYQRADRTPPAGLVRVYPHNPTRGRFAIAHPYLFKWAEKDKTHNNQFNSQNIVVYRYAELLLMLAEISNELGNGQQMTYLQPVLDRAGVTARPQFSQGQSAFRDAIMDEYHDSWHVRRRGVQYFINKTLSPHNNSFGKRVGVGWKRYAKNLEVEFSTDPNQIMQMPIPISEVNTNELIN